MIVEITDVDALAQIIRRVDGSNKLGAGALAEAILAALSPAPQALEGEAELTAAALDVLAERRRQVEAEGWTAEHDDAHEDGALALAASLYAFQAHEDGAHRHGLALARRGTCPYQWPWASDWWKPTDRRRDLVKAGALILAEIERLDRAAPEPRT